jgi:hypothetical protein
MAWTVARNDAGNTNEEFEAYSRLLNQLGYNLGKLPRSPDPKTGRRWVYVWSNRKEAEAFAKTLNKRTKGKDWVTDEVAAPPSEGPMGPIIIQVGRRSSGWILGLNSLSWSMIQKAFPDAVAPASSLSVDFESSEDFFRKYESIPKLASKVVPVLTGLLPERLDELGYALIEDDTHRTLMYSPPSELATA